MDRQQNKTDATLIPLDRPEAEMEPKQNKINAILKTLEGSSADITNVGLISSDGIILADLNDPLLKGSAGLAAILNSLALRLTNALQIGAFLETHICTEQSDLLLFDIKTETTLLFDEKQQAILVVIVNHQGDIDAARCNARTAQTQLKKVLAQAI
ncbi:MAG: hypothetical protein Q9M31_01505 [Mariprofundus sp.]|nr:hypothetical protein [Mariprofundus sp.]